MKKPSVTIIIPTYNASKTITMSLASVISQDYEGTCDIIVVNDGSTDYTIDTVSDFVALNNLKNVQILSKKNGGVSSARNTGLANVKSEFIAFLDADDVWLPGKLSAQMDIFSRNSEIYFLGTGRNSETYPFIKNKPIFQIGLRQMLLKWWPSVPTVIFKKVVFDKVGYFDESVNHGEDGDYWLRVLNLFPIHVMTQSYVVTGGGKHSFGESGLSADLKEMHQGELNSLRMARHRRQIFWFEYYCFYLIFKIKYLRRILIVRFRRHGDFS